MKTMHRTITIEHNGKIIDVETKLTIFPDGMTLITVTNKKEIKDIIKKDERTNPDS
jgi:hypothetical protein